MTSKPVALLLADLGVTKILCLAAIRSIEDAGTHYGVLFIWYKLGGP